MKRAPAKKPFGRTRIVLSDGELVRPLLALSLTAEGGLILDLSKSAPTRHYRYGILDVPAGEGSWEAPIRENAASWSVNLAPKLHYHRSGMISLNATEHLERHGIQATPLDQIGPDQKHCFSFVARHPFRWKRSPLRPSDLSFVIQEPPTTMTLAGFIGPTDNLLKEPPANPWPIMVQEEDGCIVPTIVARLHPSYYLWLKLLLDDRQFGDGDDPMLILHALDPFSAADHESKTEMVAVWSVNARDAPSDS